jgi:aryl-alcohol dehydrogenase-like predicted oxidoreductase
MQVALAWLLQRAPNIILIPGTSSVKHLRENLDAATLHLRPETIADLDLIADRAKQRGGRTEHGLDGVSRD